MPDRQPESITVEAYAVIVPVWKNSYYKDENGHPILDSAKVSRVTQRRPEAVKGGGVVTRLRFKIDAAALLPLSPQATIVITPNNTVVIQDASAEAPEVPVEDLGGL